jgi:hypothetical protein
VEPKETNCTRFCNTTDPEFVNRSNPITFFICLTSSIAKFEDQRNYFYEVLNILRTPAEYSHKLDWEHKKREEEVAELENALQSSHAALYTEREKILQTKLEND